MRVSTPVEIPCCNKPVPDIHTVLPPEDFWVLQVEHFGTPAGIPPPTKD